MFQLLAKKQAKPLADKPQHVKNFEDIKRNNPIRCTAADLQAEVDLYHLSLMAMESLFEELFICRAAPPASEFQGWFEPKVNHG
jgi:hypothetical protein